MIFVNSRFLTRNITGVERFAIEICRELKRMHPEEFRFVAPHDILQRDVADELGVELIGRRSGYFWEQVELPRFLKSVGSPVLLNLCSIAPVRYNNNVVTLHDITWIRFPETYSLPFRIFYDLFIPRICRKAGHIITVSEFSRKEISSYFNIHEEKISVVYNAVNPQFCPDENIHEGDYFLVVSSVKANKNFGFILKAFERYCQSNVNGRLYIAGDISSPNFKTVVSHEYLDNPRIVFLGRVSDSDLIKYYRGARAFLFPSLYEGFGIPVLEAQACGAVVIASDCSALPEVLEDSAILCNPKDVDEFSSSMERVFADAAMRMIYRGKGYDNVLRFSWKSSASELYEIIRS